MLILPLPFIRSIGIGGMLIPAVSVLAAITLLPALLATLGTRINSVRLLPKRFVDSGHPEDGVVGPLGRTSSCGGRSRSPRSASRSSALLVYSGVQLNPSEAQAKDFPGSGDAIDGRADAGDAGISAGVHEAVRRPRRERRDPRADRREASDGTPGVAGAVAPPDWQKGPSSLVEAFPATDGASKAVRDDDQARPRRRSKAPAARSAASRPRTATSSHAVYSNFPYVLGFVVLLTFILLARAFRSLVLPLKAVVLNLVSLAAAYGIIVFIFQKGHGSHAIWGVSATQSIIPWIPLMIFAFLFGLSMDYEVFMLTRMREAYDETGDTQKAIALGLARTGKLVTSAALVLMFAFFVLASGPGVDIKQFGIGLAAGIIFDATVIRALLVPALMRLLGEWNWWMPALAARALFVKARDVRERVAADPV